MKKINFKEKKIIFIIVCMLLLILIVTGILVWYSYAQKEQQKHKEWEKLEYVKVENNEKVNDSEEVKKEKQVEGLQFQKQILKNNDQETLFKLVVKNQTDESFEGQEIYIKFFDGNGLELGIVRSYIQPLAIGEQTEISISSEFDYSNVADYEVIFDY